MLAHRKPAVLRCAHPMSRVRQENAKSQAAWNRNARFWDQAMGEGNRFFKMLLWPATEQLLGVRPGERILDAACGNGLTSRLLAAAGVKVVAFDFSEEMIGAARGRSQSFDIDYRVLDATDYAALLALGEGTFDGAVCNMALMDMADIEPLMRAVAKLLRSGGRFVFSTMHPCFNNPASLQMSELEDREGTLITTYAVKVWGYLTPFTRPGLAMPLQPVPHLYFHRPLSVLLGAGFKAGFVLDGLEERSFAPDEKPGSSPLAWSGHFSDIPPALVVRLRTTALSHTQTGGPQ